jgi:REP element-mobilizing transposase RayT
MSRLPRIDFPGARHHVMNRGARRAPVFLDDEAYVLFLRFLAQLPSRFGVIVHGYALMPNHFHLLLETPRGNLSEAMAWLTGGFTQRLNYLHHWDGPVFRGRFRNRVVEDDPYWTYLLAYVHLNPVRAYLVPHEDKAQWTSHAAYAGRSVRPEWLTCAPLLALYGDAATYAEYVHEVRVKRRAAPTEFADLWGRSLVEEPPSGDQEDRRATAVARLELVLGRPISALRVDVRALRPARWVAAWWLVRGAGLTLGAAAALLGARHPNAVHALMANIRKHRDDPQIAAWLAQLQD